MRKKALFLIIFLSITVPCFAAVRWISVYEDSSLSVYLDTQRIRTYTKNDDKYVNCWLWWGTDKGHCIEHTFFDTSSEDFLIKEVYVYDLKGTVITSYNEENRGWQAAIPNSRMEAVEKNVAAWEDDNGY